MACDICGEEIMNEREVARDGLTRLGAQKLSANLPKALRETFGRLADRFNLTSKDSGLYYRLQASTAYSNRYE